MIDLAVFDQAFLITGPTASGKSALALALAEQCSGEIVSMDSMAIYRGMDIGTAKPDLHARQRVPHHLLDCLDPWESASVAWWLEQAASAVTDIVQRRQRPVIVGGTPLYLKALLHGLFEGPPIDDAFRKDLESRSAAELLMMLKPHDPAAAEKIHHHDHKRLVRALEVFHATGKPLSSLQQQFSTKPCRQTPVICMELPRDELYRRIDVRVESMMEQGWLDEVRSLLQLPHPLSRQAAQAAGYRELADHLLGQCSLEQAVKATKTRSRQLAKRQLTWFRNFPGLQMLDATLPTEQLIGYISSMTAAKGSAGHPL